jgi:hypothetical protein
VFFLLSCVPRWQLGPSNLPRCMLQTSPSLSWPPTTGLSSLSNPLLVPCNYSQKGSSKESHTNCFDAGTMELPLLPYIDQVETWPASGRVLLASWDAEAIVVYQAYKPSIGKPR